MEVGWAVGNGGSSCARRWMLTMHSPTSRKVKRSSGDAKRFTSRFGIVPYHKAGVVYWSRTSPFFSKTPVHPAAFTPQIMEASADLANLKDTLPFEVPELEKPQLTRRDARKLLKITCGWLRVRHLPIFFVVYVVAGLAHAWRGGTRLHRSITQTSMFRRHILEVARTAYHAESWPKGNLKLRRKAQFKLLALGSGGKYLMMTTGSTYSTLCSTCVLKEGK